MAQFKQVRQTFLFRQLLKYWGNMVKNFDYDCGDNDFFDVVYNNFDHDKGVELIEVAYTEKELNTMMHSKCRNRRLDFTDTLDDVFFALWNNEAVRDKCRAVLDAIREYMETDCEQTGDDIVECRFNELIHVLKLNELESELLLFAYVRDQTCFSWPLRIRDRDKPLYYAMALNRSFDEVSRAMSPQSTLLKFNLLDSDYDFNTSTLGGFMDGTSDEAISYRFYTKGGNVESLPWEFFGELASRDGEVLKRMISASGGKCNVLLYGVPGTGKTSFAHTLAKELGRTVCEIRQGDVDGRNMKSEARMVGIQVCNAQESPDESLMVVDEIGRAHV